MSGHATPGETAVHRVLLTGATGFVGFRTARRLLSLGHEVRALVRRGGEAAELAGAGGAAGGKYHEIIADFVDPEAAAAAGAGCDVVVHCAATSGAELDAVRRVNRDGTRSMLAAAAGSGARRFVQISTVSVYDFTALNGADLDEEAPLCTEGDPYGVTKAEGDRLVLEAAGKGLPATILRPGAILGLHPTSTWAVKVPRRVREGGALPDRDPASTHPFVHVEDLVDAVLLAIEVEPTPGAAEVYNAVSHNGTWGGYLGQIRAWFGLGPAQPPDEVAPATGRNWTGHVRSDRLRRFLGWAPIRTYMEGMREAESYWASVSEIEKR
ncbi:MAG TPA: NAD(P)-dependent oxidoreductase [Acidobacteriota bacterium]|nr:NAD(P)-dependent oxidoreductase [Acidobacteriota bacterium]